MYEECLIHLRRLLQMLEEEYTDIAHSLQGELLDAYRQRKWITCGNPYNCCKIPIYHKEEIKW